MANEEIIPMSFEYLGGEGGIHWDDEFYSTIRRFVINHREWICSIQIEYDDDGRSVWSNKHGEMEEGLRSEVVLDYPEEYLISVRGYYGEIDEWGIAATVIRSLTLESNKKTYGPFGIEDGSGTKFTFSAKGFTKIVGFHGRSGWYLDSIGLHVHTTQENRNEVVQFSLGEFGGNGGRRWKEVFSRIRSFVVNHGAWIDSIQIEYDDNDGNTFFSPKHGGNGGSPSQVILEFPDEYLISIHGHYDDIHRWGIAATVIRSLTFETNRRKYGPFGVEQGTQFSFLNSGVKIVGIHGRSGLYLDSIGLFALPI